MQTQPKPVLVYDDRTGYFRPIAPLPPIAPAVELLLTAARVRLLQQA